MSSNMLEAIVRIHSHLYTRGRCCKDMKATKRMIELFDSKNMYKRQETEERASTSQSDELMIVEELD